MDLFTGDGYYELNRLLLLIIGQWPDQDHKMKLILMIIIVFYLGFCLLGQIIKLIKAGHDLDLIFEILVSFLSNSICIIRYCNCIVNAKKFTKLFRDIQDLWNVTKIKEEIEIMKMYAKESKDYTLFLTVVSYFSLGFVNLLSLMPCILDIILPLNVTRTRKYLYQAEFFLNTEKYFYPILLHMWITIFFGVTILVSTESIFLMFAQHCCSMFKVLCYRLEHAFDTNLENTDMDNAYYEARYKITDCVKYHTKILEFVAIIISYHEYSFIIQFLIIVLLASIILVQIKMFLGKLEVLLYLTLLGSIFCHGFLCAYPAQKIMDHNNLLFENAYNGYWYLAPIKAQKLLLLVIKKSIINTPIILMKSIEISHRSFGVAIKTSFSYFTVLCSLR